MDTLLMTVESNYQAALRYYLVNHPKDPQLVLECGNTNDFGVNLIALAAGKTPAEVLRDLSAKSEEIWPTDEDFERDPRDDRTLGLGG